MVDRATAARTIAELRAEIDILRGWKTWPCRSAAPGRPQVGGAVELLQNNAEMFDAEGRRRKLIIFTEHRDTLNYLAERIRTLLGVREAVVTIHGGMGREERQQGPGRLHAGPGRRRC